LGSEKGINDKCVSLKHSKAVMNEKHSTLDRYSKSSTINVQEPKLYNEMQLDSQPINLVINQITQSGVPNADPLQLSTGTVGNNQHADADHNKDPISHIPGEVHQNNQIAVFKSLESSAKYQQTSRAFHKYIPLPQQKYSLSSPANSQSHSTIINQREISDSQPRYQRVKTLKQPKCIAPQQTVLPNQLNLNFLNTRPNRNTKRDMGKGNIQTPINATDPSKAVKKVFHNLIPKVQANRADKLLKKSPSRAIQL